jgi:hypothetical protein
MAGIAFGSSGISFFVGACAAAGPVTSQAAIAAKTSRCAKRLAGSIIARAASE